MIHSDRVVPPAATVGFDDQHCESTEWLRRNIIHNCCETGHISGMIAQVFNKMPAYGSSYACDVHCAPKLVVCPIEDEPMLIRDRTRVAPTQRGVAFQQDGRPYKERENVQ
jgi:hypothetical protein